jgi:hypothetical protein
MPSHERSGAARKHEAPAKGREPLSRPSDVKRDIDKALKERREAIEAEMREIDSGKSTKAAEARYKKLEDERSALMEEEKRSPAKPEMKAANDDEAEPAKKGAAAKFEALKGRMTDIEGQMRKLDKLKTKDAEKEWEKLDETRKRLSKEAAELKPQAELEEIEAEMREIDKGKPTKAAEAKYKKLEDRRSEIQETVKNPLKDWKFRKDETPEIALGDEDIDEEITLATNTRKPIARLKRSNKDVSPVPYESVSVGPVMSETKAKRPPVPSDAEGSIVIEDAEMAAQAKEFKSEGVRTLKHEKSLGRALKKDVEPEWKPSAAAEMRKIQEEEREAETRKAANVETKETKDVAELKKRYDALAKAYRKESDWSKFDKEVGFTWEEFIDTRKGFFVDLSRKLKNLPPKPEMIKRINEAYAKHVETKKK